MKAFLLCFLSASASAAAQTTVTPAPVAPAAVSSPPLTVTVTATTVTITGGVSPVTIPVPAPTCTIPQPNPTTATIACPSGSTGSWVQTTSYVAAAYPACWTPQVSPTSAPAGSCVTNTLADAVVTTGGVNILASTTVNWDYGNISQAGPITYAGKAAWQMSACTSAVTATTQKCSNVPAGGGGGWLNPFPSPNYLNLAGYNYVVVTLAATRAGQVWLLGQPFIPNTATASDQPVPGTLSVTLSGSNCSPAPAPGVWSVCKIPLHSGGVNLPTGSLVIMKQGIQDQINSSGNNPTLGAGNIWYIADVRYTVN